MNFVKPLTVIVFVFSIGVCPSAAQTVATWIHTDGGRWGDSTSWDIGVVPANSPGETFDVFINGGPGTPFSVTMPSNSAIDNFTLDSEDATFTTYSGRVEDLVNIVRGRVEMPGGAVLDAGEIKLNGNELNAESGTIKRALIRDFDLAGSVLLENGATVTGTVRLKKKAPYGSGSLKFRSEESDPVQIRVDDAVVNMAIDSELLSSDSIDLVFGANSLLVGQGTVGLSGANRIRDAVDVGEGTFINEGRMLATVRGGELTIDTGLTLKPEKGSGPYDNYIKGRFINRGEMISRSGSGIQIKALPPAFSSLANLGTFINDSDGQIIVEEDAEFHLAGTWSNRGNIDIHNGGLLTADSTSSYTTDDIRRISIREGGKIFLQGHWDNRGQTFQLPAEGIELGAITLQGGTFDFQGQPIKPAYNRNFVDAFITNGDLQLDDLDRSVKLIRSRLVGDIAINENGLVEIRDSDTSGIGKVSLGNERAEIEVHWQNGSVDWQSLVEGQGRVSFGGTNGETGHGVRNLGTIRANVDGGRLEVSSTRSGNLEQFTNRGIMEAVDGGVLSLRDSALTNGGIMEAVDGGVLSLSVTAFDNEADAVVRANENSSVYVYLTAHDFKNDGRIEVRENALLSLYQDEDGNFSNDGTIEVRGNGTLRMGGEYSNLQYDGLVLADTATVELTGTMNLGETELFTPIRQVEFGEFFDVQGGQLNFENINGLGKIRGRITDSTIVGDLHVSHGSSLEFRGSTSVSGNTIIDGPETVLHASGSGEGKSIIFAEGGTLSTDSSEEFFIAAGTTLSGDGNLLFPLHTSRFQPIFNQGTIDISGNDHFTMGPDGVATYPRSSFDYENIVQAGTVRVRDEARISVIGDGVRYFQRSGETILDGGVLSVEDNLIVAAGEVYGNGTLMADKFEFSGGSLSPGLTIGELFLVGDANFLERAFFPVYQPMNLNFDVAGTGQGEPDGHDFLSIEGNMMLGTTREGSVGSYLNVRTLDDVLIDDLLNTELTIIELADAYEISGVFANVDNGGLLATADGRFQFNVFYGAESSYGSNRVVLTNFSLKGVPEPCASVLLLLASAMATVRRRRLIHPGPASRLQT